MGGGHIKEKFFWCPKCQQAVPQLSPDHQSGECHCEMKKTGKHVEMLLLPEDDKRVAAFVEHLRKDMSEARIYLNPFHIRVHTGFVQFYVREEKRGSYVMGVEMKGGHSEFAINQSVYLAFCDNAHENRVKMGFRCKDNPKCPGNDPEFAKVS